MYAQTGDHLVIRGLDSFFCPTFDEQEEGEVAAAAAIATATEEEEEEEEETRRRRRRRRRGERRRRKRREGRGRKGIPGKLAYTARIDDSSGYLLLLFVLTPENT